MYDMLFQFGVLSMQELDEIIIKYFHISEIEYVRDIEMVKMPRYVKIHGKKKFFFLIEK